ncbi:MAG: hypothetical protein LBP69_08885, partial [Treponema sp.]|nr:hypothetical protein [Treponema sp.]
MAYLSGAPAAHVQLVQRPYLEQAHNTLSAGPVYGNGTKQVRAVSIDTRLRRFLYAPVISSGRCTTR